LINHVCCGANLKTDTLTPWPPLSRKKTRERGGKKNRNPKGERIDGLNRGWTGWRNNQKAEARRDLDRVRFGALSPVIGKKKVLFRRQAQEDSIPDSGSTHPLAPSLPQKKRERGGKNRF